jgi:hypothetical protein
VVVVKGWEPGGRKAIVAIDSKWPRSYNLLLRLTGGGFFMSGA